MSTTTVRLPADLKARVARVAKRAGITTHGFILQAIAEKAEQDERRGDFHANAERRHSDIAASGKTVPWSEVRRFLEQRVTGKRAVRPVAKKPANRA